jgi:aspartate racemase
MKSVGVIGGLGPETTAKFYLEVIFKCQDLNKTQRPSVIVSSVPLNFAIERDLIATNTGIERYIPFLTNEAERLEKSGVDFLVMPCNSLHVFINEIRDSVSIPVLSIVEETIKYIQANGFTKVGLIATSATLENNVYESKFIENSIGYMAPNKQQRAQMNTIIQRLIDGQHLNSDRRIITNVAEDLLEQGADSIALACTDLQLLNPSSQKIIIFDTMKILAESTVQYLLDESAIQAPVKQDHDSLSLASSLLS